MAENFLAQLKGVVDPMTVFTHYLSLKKSGNRYRALCPFHNEKTPSFYASDNGMFHCFGCGAGGDVVKFVMLMEHMDFKDCAQLLAQRYGIQLKTSAPGEKKERDELLDLMRKAADYYHNLLTTHPSGEPALRYLEERGITRDTVRRFQLGWAPQSWHALLEHFQKREINAALLEKCGLVIPRQQEGFYDRFRGRIMVPIHDLHGNILAMGGRIFEGTGEEAKYMNSPESPLYTKSNHLFGLYFSREAVQEKKFAILVEGYFDMIVPFQAGITNIAASLGTSLTENQVRLLRRYTDHVVLFYDPDTAGRTAVLRALPMLLKENFGVRVAQLPQGLDPDKYVRERGAEAFRSEIQKAISYDELFLVTLQEELDLTGPGGRLEATQRIVELLSTVSNPFERDQVMRKFATAMHVEPLLLHEQFRKRQKSQSSPSSITRTSIDLDSIEKKLLQILLQAPSISQQVLPQLAPEDLEMLTGAEFFRILHQIVSDLENPNTAEVIGLFPEQHQSFLSALVMEAEADPPSLEFAMDCINAIRKRSKKRSLLNLNSRIDEDAILEEKHRLAKELKSKES